MSNINNSKKQFSNIQAILTEAAQNNLNVLLRGESGVGKTHIIMEIAKIAGFKVKYFSASTLDPFADLIGIPVPRENYVEYLRQQDINDADFMFFDELNRAHKRVTNAVLEIIQFKTLNGDVLPKLKMVWAAINPSGNNKYNTETLDVAILDRFHLNIDIPYNISYSYFNSKYDKIIADASCEWWWGLSNDLKNECSPRRLDYIVDAIVNKRNISHIQPFDQVFPIEKLKQSILLSFKKLENDDIYKNMDKYIEIIKEGDTKNKEYAELVKMLVNIKKDELSVAKLIPLISELPAEYISKIIVRNNKYKDIRKHIYENYGVDKLIKWDSIIQEKINN